MSDLAGAEDDVPEICSTLRWQDVSLPASITAADLDALIFAELAPNWRKVARIVGNAFDASQSRSFCVSAEVIAARIQALADARKIESEGNLSMWRHSEVRLKSGL